ncbi:MULTISPECIES: arsenate reductase/protein-tyrosine-phosphatase family protein [Xanthobacteraceae]|jgi:arsenate reductase|uniref:ArsR family transcriptional regulator n=1 Tax=Xanthobacter flavus TaxID=281 RepID=A0A9W6CML4_XANFL|nr:MULTISPECIES: helix-turn-helix domain-containing protein [Xanthobacter]MBN8917106.1 helix-turn-helix domain-containing protein [Hyphomicrobiales bacterium]MBP2147464.1 arsenate reductase [Xanthobacter flavus]MCG5237185.1 helix-turn-helix domain-containing protein [Xanthobacter oligotrophicus]MDI4662945.1 helix-turn-helix domain-containing protein [Xanthobacter autotrophicus]MDR6331607.1 arsenate reductase [Xanthobacter flavus]
MDETKLNGEDATRIFDALSQGTRFETYRLLLRYVPYGLQAGDIARLLAVAHNTMSVHLGVLERAGLVTSRREGRSIIYAVSLSTAGPVLSQLMAEMGFAVSPRCGTGPAAFPQLRPAAGNDRVYNVLLVCSANSARSLIAEALLNREGRGRFKAYSAGSRPKLKPHSMAIDLLDSLGYDTTNLASKSWDGFARPDAPQMDFVITTCDAAAGEICPAFPGHPLQAHWGLPDPIRVKGTEAEQKAAFVATYRRLAGRISAFVNLPFEQLDLASLKERIGEIGKMEGATDLTLSGQAA